MEEQIVMAEANIYNVLMVFVFVFGLIFAFILYINYAKSEEGRKAIDLREKYKTERTKAMYDYRLRRIALKNEAKYIAKNQVDDYDVSDIRAELSQ